MKKPKFNIEIFFKVFAKENISKFALDRPHILFEYALSKGYGYENDEDFSEAIYLLDGDYWNFMNPKKSFLHVSKSLNYFPILQIHDNEPGGEWDSAQEFGYLYSKKSDLSFLVNTRYFRSDNDRPKPINVFKKFNSKNISELQKLTLNFIKKHNPGGLCNVVNLNDKMKWNFNKLTKLFKNAAKDRNKQKKKDRTPNPVDPKELTVDSPDWYYDIWFFTMNEKKMTSKTPFFSFDKAIVKIEPSGKIIKLK